MIQGKKSGLRKLDVTLTAGMLMFFAAVMLAGCGEGLFSYKEFNPDAGVSVNFLDGAIKASFGESARREDENWATIDLGNGVARINSNRLPESGEFNAGKIANSVDGLTYLFREVPADRNFKLSATVTLIRFGGVGPEGETTSNGQEGFGLMARDFIPLYPEYSIEELSAAALLENPWEDYFISSSSHSGRSNMIFAGGVKRGVRYGYRSGVTGSIEVVTNPEEMSDGTYSRFVYKPDELDSYAEWLTLEERPDYPVVNGTYRISLEKTNSGFYVSMTPPAGKGEAWQDFIWEPDLLESIDPDVYYVGFFAARAAEIEVSDISFILSPKDQDAPREEPQPLDIVPELTIISPETNSHPLGRFYRLIAMANVPGYLSVRQNGSVLTGAEWVESTWLSSDSNYSNIANPAYFDIPVRDLLVGENVFQLMFYPEGSYPKPGYLVGNTEPIKRTFLVERKLYFDSDTTIYASPDGRSSNTGSYNSPLDIETAIDFVQPGQKVILKDGVYELLSFRIPRYNSGRAGYPKRLEAETRDGVFIDFKKNPYATGAVLEGSYWELSGIHFRNTPNKVKGLEIMGANNLIEWVKTYNNGDTGMQISGRSNLPTFMWPMNNTVLYSESYNNRDAAEIDSDGFGAKLTVGNGNRYEWCISHNNADDGWDLYSKVETGYIGVVTIENCVSYRNGILMDGRTSAGGKNGFKLGGEGMPIAHVLSNSLAFQNGANGVTGNSNPAIVLARVTSFDNGSSNHRNFTIYDSAGSSTNLAAVLTGILSIYSPEKAIGRSDDRVELKVPATGYAWITGATRNTNAATLSSSDMHSLVPPLWDSGYTALLESGQGFIKRKPDGSFDLADFMRPIPLLTAGAVF